MIRAPPACWYSASASMSGISSMAPLRMQRAAALGAEGAGLDREGADRAIIRVAAMCVVIQHCPRDRVPIFTADVEDLVQETLLALHVRRHTYDPDQPFTPWVYAIARYKLIDYLRRTRASVKNVPLDAVQEIAAHDDHVASESTLDLNQLLERLTPKVRDAIRYVKLDGLTVAEAAARGGMSESAVKVNVHRGMKTLSALIARGRRS